MVPITDFPPSELQSRSGVCCPILWDAIDSGASACGFNVTGGTHDSAPAHRIASLTRSDFLPAAPKREVQSEATTAAEADHTASVESGIATQDVSIPTAIMAVTSVRVQQFVEPFAVVGPRLTPTRESLTQFLDWCNEVANNPPVDLKTAQSAKTQAAALVADSPSSPVVSIDRLLDSLAADEPVDVEVNYVEVRNYVERNDAIIEESSISVAKIDPLVGSSAIVATLGSGPYASDLSDEDEDQAGQVRLWSVLPTVTRPFCIRHSFDHFELDSFSMTETSKAHHIDAGSDDLAKIGDVDSMLADARSSMASSIALAFQQAQADAIVATASDAVTLMENIGTWAASQEVAAKQQALKDASLILAQATDANPVSGESLQDLGRGIIEWTFAGQEMASQAAVAVAKIMPSNLKPAAKEPAAMKRRRQS